MVQVKDKKVKEIVRLKKKGFTYMAYCQANGMLLAKVTGESIVKVYSLF